MNVPDMFGSMVFNDAAMKSKLPKDVYMKLKETIDSGVALDPTVADVVANAMMDWAMEKGATHFSHWFQPMTGITAEKHDSFITPVPGGKVMMDFSGKELIKGESDASSFPSGGLRATFEARGYTAWDPTSYAFIKDHTLYVPTVFASYSGEALDKKTPLLRSVELVNKEAVRLLHILGKTDVTRVTTTVGPEQEYFLIDRALSYKRKDILFTGRTLFGAKPPKGQELEDHYFGAIKPRITAFMEDLNEELWKLGVLAKTEHNEVAPAQHELAPIFATTNIATDHNQLTMEALKDVARRHDLSCLLHEKPFAGVNGSGKHNNWSMSTNTGENLLRPGKKPEENIQFLLFLTAIVKAVDEYQDLLRVSVATAGNDHRLGANEAPPAIISMFLGEDLSDILESYENGVEYVPVTRQQMETGVAAVPSFQKDTSDRNRTSPFAFTGNKFEFRMLGSASSISDTNTVMNTIAADAIGYIADQLEGAEDVMAKAKEIIRDIVMKHKRIIFNGNNYSEEWVQEAERRGLLNLKNTADAIPHLVDEKNIALFTRHGIYTAEEVHSRCEILLDNYCKVLHIEALTMLEMSKKEIIPAVSTYLKDMSTAAASIKAVVPDADCFMQESIIAKAAALSGSLYKKTEALSAAVLATKEHEENIEDRAQYYKNSIFPGMQELRAVADELETMVGEEYWPFPTYGDLLFKI
ncbi:MAG: glutamine synthetase III [Peptococcaceae bacterium]|nr:glutamine synthetase III [Peptococcaceae bacterium]MBQ2035703.1 glutamine synthetase III [Peptococcaceae bacterium]MBQ2448567.1 glutamine synthetase III [Peptococcaceae bacterium]MBQ5683732.1 glutamine synthetase III [Peptococcaceae bacterium]MBQ5857668.1 glutamine synthetase III [Peptococcaceae bacterium]